ncbi:unnamed protein product [Lactuca saligna]|uniref:Uncharacterized protein n=1 Tax=Lactuca saligna TaxID=75948 RepID=A0AA35YAC2_LACSI|nr:unnamed protein product [Lactuca saligna]
MDNGGDLVVGTQLGKRKRALLEEDEETEVADLCTESQDNHEVCSRCGGTHRFAYHRSFQVQLSYFGCGGSSGTNVHRSSGGQGRATINLCCLHPSMSQPNTTTNNCNNMEKRKLIWRKRLGGEEDGVGLFEDQIEFNSYRDNAFEDEVEDTNEDLFDKLVDDDDDGYKVTPLSSETTKLVDGNDSDDAKAFANLGINDVSTKVEDLGKVGVEIPKPKSIIQISGNDSVDSEDSYKFENPKITFC